MMNAHLCAAGLLVALLVLTGCGGSSTDDADGEAAPSPDVSTAGTAPEDTGRPKDAQSGAASPTGLTGFAATRKEWLTAHEQAPGFSKGSAFLPMVETASGPYPKYGGVSHSTPVVIYIINLPSGTTLAEAKRIALEEFPPGARYGVLDQQQKRCVIATIKSKQAETSMQQHGYKGWVPGAAFGTDTASTSMLDRSNVTSISMIPIERPKGGQRDLGFC